MVGWKDRYAEIFWIEGENYDKFKNRLDDYTIRNIIIGDRIVFSNNIIETNVNEY